MFKNRLRALAVVAAVAFGHTFLFQEVMAQGLVCYEYDELGRLSAADYDHTGSGDSSIDYSYEPNHNITDTATSMSASATCATPSGVGISAAVSGDPGGPGDPGTTNTAPVAVNDHYTPIYYNTATNLSVLSNDTDADNDTLTISAVADPPLGATSIGCGGTCVVYTAAANGNDSFTYTISDGFGGQDTATVTTWNTGMGGGGGDDDF